MITRNKSLMLGGLFAGSLLAFAMTVGCGATATKKPLADAVTCAELQLSDCESAKDATQAVRPGQAADGSADKSRGCVVSSDGQSCVVAPEALQPSSYDRCEILPVSACKNYAKGAAIEGVAAAATASVALSCSTTTNFATPRCYTTGTPQVPTCDQALVGKCTEAKDTPPVGCVNPPVPATRLPDDKVRATGGCWKNKGSSGPTGGSLELDTAMNCADLKAGLCAGATDASPAAISTAGATENKCKASTATTGAACVVAAGSSANPLCTAIGANVVYVKQGATGGDGTSFAKAFSSIQQAVDAIQTKRPATSSDLYIIAVAQGTYQPKGTAAIPGGFAGVDIKGQANLHILGGFNGDKECKENRSADAKLTVIDTEKTHENRVLHLVYAKAGDGKNVTIEGMTLTGSGNGGGIEAGGAIRATFADLKLVNVRFENNTNDSGGAGVALYASNTVIDKCIFVGNVSSGSGGAAILAVNSEQNGTPGKDAVDMTVSISNCVFGDKDHLATGANKADGGKGGAIWNKQQRTPASAGKSLKMTVSDSMFYGNEAKGDGGAIANDGDLKLSGMCFFGDNKVSAGSRGSAVANIQTAPKATFAKDPTVKLKNNFVDVVAQNDDACISGP